MKQAFSQERESKEHLNSIWNTILITDKKSLQVQLCHLLQSFPPPISKLPQMHSFLSVLRGGLLRLYPLEDNGRGQQEGETTFSRAFCRRCLEFCCLQHPISPIPVISSALSARLHHLCCSAKPCGPHCFMNFSEKQQQQQQPNNSNSTTTWALQEVELFKSALDIFDDGTKLTGSCICVISKLIGTTKTCVQTKAFYDHWQETIGESDLSLDPSTVSTSTPTSVNKRGRKHKAVSKKNSLIEQTENKILFIPCSHSGPCANCHSYCEKCITLCPQNPIEAMNKCKHTKKIQIPCQKYCLCDPKCDKRKKGCKCSSGNCGPHCPCVINSTECDPDICANCNSCFKLHTKDSPGTHCGNMGIQCGRFKRVLLAISQVPNAGWGLFTAEDIKNGELIGVYGGELVTRKETHRVDKGQYSSSLSEFLEVSGLFIANKLRFINDPEIIPASNGTTTTATTTITTAATTSSSSKEIFAANLRPTVVNVNGSLCYALHAIQNISAGSELFFPYGSDYWQMLRQHSDSDSNSDSENDQ